MIEGKESSWFADWFNTPFYHDLYRNRDHEEAFRWIEKIIELIPLQKELPILDICCGNGRHALYFEQLGWNACGIDISPENIKIAKANSKHPMHWKVEDAKTFLWEQPFQLVTNLFTSFGYFDDSLENERMIKNIFHHASNKGWVIIDFLNAPWVIKTIKNNEVIKGLLTEYHINRRIDNHQIVKDIEFIYEQKNYQFQERVYLYHPGEFIKWGKDMGFELRHHIGDYNGEHYQTTSPRSIFVFQRK
jgi:SAM-dependent methyltransferase